MTTKTKDKREYVAAIDPRALKPYDKNARVHSEEQIETIMRSIDEFGWTKPVLIDEYDMILAGHGATQAAIRKELKTIDAVRVRNLTDAQKRAYVLADNSLALNSEWDLELLAAEFKSLEVDAFDMSLMAFDHKTIEIIDRINTPPTTGGIGGGGSQIIGGNRFLLMLEFEREQDLQAMFEEMTGRQVQCKILD